MNTRHTVDRVTARTKSRLQHTADLVRRRVHHSGALPFTGRMPATNPILPVADMAEAIAFYRRLGFEVNAYDPQYAWVRHCGWEWLHLRAVESVDNNQASAYLHVENADAWRAAMVKAAGGTVTLGALTDMAWGLREFSFTDPAGNVVRVGHPI